VYGWHALAGVLLAANWLGYVWGVHQGRVIECSLGYFINPLVSILLGVVVLRERLRPAQWVAIALAAVAVCSMAIANGQVPWLALMLAFSFGSYGLVRKMSGLESAQGLFVETAILAPLALAGLVWWELRGLGHFLHHHHIQSLLLIATGIVTTIPLLLFGKATRLLPLSTVGFLQYLTPTVQFAIGLWVFGETVSLSRWLGFSLVWLALALFATESLWHASRKSLRA
jgi:chloramphenicol-sensitive protein RarD